MSIYRHECVCMLVCVCVGVRMYAFRVCTDDLSGVYWSVLENCGAMCMHECLGRCNCECTWL